MTFRLKAMLPDPDIRVPTFGYSGLYQRRRIAQISDVRRPVDLMVALSAECDEVVLRICS